MQPVRNRYAVSADMGRPISAERSVLTASADPRPLLITLGHDSVSYGFAAPRQDVWQHRLVAVVGFVVIQVWLRWRDSNPRPHGYEPCELPLLYTAICMEW